MHKKRTSTNDGTEGRLFHVGTIGRFGFFFSFLQGAIISFYSYPFERAIKILLPRVFFLFFFHFVITFRAIIVDEHAERYNFSLPVFITNVLYCS